VNTAGDVIGVNTAASSNYQYAAAGGTGYAIPINSAMAIARQIQSGAGSDIVHVGPTGMLGVTVVGAASPGNDDRSGSGLPVAAVSAGSPAAKAGLAPGHQDPDLRRRRGGLGAHADHARGPAPPGTRWPWCGRTRPASGTTPPWC